MSTKSKFLKTFMAIIIIATIKASTYQPSGSAEATHELVGTAPPTNLPSQCRTDWYPSSSSDLCSVSS